MASVIPIRDVPRIVLITDVVEAIGMCSWPMLAVVSP